MDSFSDLEGKALSRVVVTCEDEALGRDNQIAFMCDDGSVYRLYHAQICCEEVYIEDVCGDWSDLLGGPLRLAEEASRDNHVKSIDGRRRGQEDSTTWTFYKLEGAQGSVTIRWTGTSNGYYSERVDFERVGADFYGELFPRDPDDADDAEHLDSCWRRGGENCGLRLRERVREGVALVVTMVPAAAAPERYAELNALCERFERHGLTVLGLPDLERSPRLRWITDAEGFEARFPVARHYYHAAATKLRDPLISWLCGPWTNFGGPIEGPFEMFLIDHHGRVAARFASGTCPLSDAVVSAVAKQLSPSTLDQRFPTN